MGCLDDDQDSVLKKRHEDDGFCHHLLCLRGARTWGGEDNDDRKSLSSIFHMNDEGIRKKDTKLIALWCNFCVWKQQEQEEEAKITMTRLLFFIFHKSDKC